MMQQELDVALFNLKGTNSQTAVLERHGVDLESHVTIASGNTPNYHTRAGELQIQLICVKEQDSPMIVK